MPTPLSLSESSFTNRSYKPPLSSSDVFTGRETENIVFHDCKDGLGIKVVGGVDEHTNQSYSVFVKRVFPGGVAFQRGGLSEGDLLVQVNGFCLVEVTNDRAVQILRQASAEQHVELIVCRDQQAKTEFESLLDNSYCTSINSTTSSVSFSKPISDCTSRPDPLLTEVKSVSDWVESLPQSSTAPSDLTPLFVVPQGRKCDMARHHLRGLSTPTMSSTPLEPPCFVGGRDFRFAPHVLSMASDGPHSEPSPVLPDHSSGRHHYNTEDPLSINDMQDHEVSHNEPRSERSYKLDPQIRLHIGKLQIALKYLGLNPTSLQHQSLVNQLNIDDNGSVLYGEFVEAARRVFKFELKERSISITPQLLSSAEIQEITDPPAFLSQPTEFEMNTEVLQLQLHNDKLKRDIQRLKMDLRDREKACAFAEDELIRSRQEAQGAIEETRLLRHRVQLAEQAQKAAQSIETDYEDVIRMLEVKVTKLQAQQDKQLESPVVQRRLAVLSCQVKKSEASKKTYEVATEKLLTFLETMYEGLKMNNSVQSLTSKGDRRKNSSLQGLANEAHGMIKSVRSLVEIEPLPFGWDEAYTEDGMKYYMNHVTQVTQWSHPVSKVTRLSPRQHPKQKHQHKSTLHQPSVNINKSNCVMESSA